MTGIAGNADRYLAAGIYGYELANVAEIMRDYPSFDKESMDELLLNVFYPVNNWFLRNHNDAHFGNYWANWDLCNIASIMAIGIFTDREDIYNQAIEYYKSGIGNGFLYNAMPFAFEDGMVQWQESCRDQGHCTFGVGLCAAICEMAWNQGDDLYGLSDNRFLKAAEYVAAYNNGVDGLPYESYKRYSGQKGTIEWWGVLSDAGRGSNRPIYSLIYNHYVNRKGLEAPNLKNVLFPNDGYAVETNNRKGDELGWETLMFSNLSERVEDKPIQGYFADGIYRIRSEYTGRSLVVNTDGNLLSAESGTREDEWWKLENLGDGEYIITNMLTNKVMQINDKSYAEGAVFGTGDETKELNQRFGFEKNSNGTYRLVSSMTTYVAGIAGDSTAEDAAIIQWKINGNTGQSWILERKSELLACFTFDDEDTGFTDGNGVAQGEHSLQEHDGGNALYLNGTSDFLKVSAEDGSSLLTGVKELTVSFQAKPEEGAKWMFYAAPNEDVQIEQQEEYLGITQNNDGTVSAKRYKNQGEKPADASAAAEAGEDGWYHVTVVYTENETILYVNGEEKVRQPSEYPLTDILGDNSILYIGKANCGDGEYYKGLIDNYTIYGRALSPEEVKAEAVKYIEVPDILADFTFDDKETGFTNGYGVASGGYTLKKHGKGNALYLDGIANCLQVETIYGTSLLSNVKEMSVSFQAKPEGGTNWVFYAAPNENTQAFQYENYLGIMQSTDGTATAQRYKNQGARPADTAAAAKADDDGWYDVTVVYTENETILYVDGKEAARQSSQYPLEDILGEDSVLYIGKANWGKEEYYKGLIDNYTIYGYALTPEEIQRSILQSKTELIDPSESVRYTEETWPAYAEALENAKEVLSDSEATLERLSAAADALDEARAGLKRPEILADFTFDDEESGFTNGYSVAAGSYSLQDHGEGKALYLDGTSDFLEVTVKDGSSLLTDAKELTISLQAKPEDGTNWLFYAAPDEKTQKYAKEKYLGIMQSTDGTATVQRYQNQDQRPEDTVTAAEPDDAGWYNLTIVYTEAETILYVNGKEAARQTGQYALEDILGGESILYIGKANWGNGEYYKGLIDNYKIIGRALTAEEVEKQAGLLALRTAIEDAKTDQGNYTDESWLPYETAVSAARAVLAKDDAEQTEIDEAIRTLKETKAALEVRNTVTYRVTNVGQAGQRLVPDGNSKEEGSNIITWPQEDGLPYYWAFKPVDGGYQIVNVNSNLVITDTDGGIKQYKAGERDGQLWILESVEGKEHQYRIKNVDSSRYLTLGDGFFTGYYLSAADKNEGNQAQLWTLEATDIRLVQAEIVNGTVDPQFKAVTAGENCDFTVTVDEGYELVSITVNGALLDEKDYEVSDEGTVRFARSNITENTYVMITNVEKDATEFYAWKDHETTLPLRKIQGLCDTDGRETEEFNNRDCTAVKGGDGMIFTGKMAGDVTVHYLDTDGNNLAVTVHVYEPENKAYVLDYGLPVDLNQEGDSSLGVTQISGADKYAISAVKPEPVSTNAVTEFLGIRSHEDEADTWAKEYSDHAENSGISTLKWNGTQMLYTPSAFLEGADVYDYRVDVKKNLDVDMDAADSTSEDGVRMAGTITVVPAEVVYYEDDFSAITVSGTFETEGSSKDRNQSNAQSDVYGYDAAYINDEMLVHYDFSELQDAASGTTIPDISGNNRPASIKGNGAAVSGDVLTLPGGEKDSDAAYVELPKGLTDGKDAITISVWMKNETGAGNYTGIFIGNDDQKYWLFNPKNPKENNGGCFKSVITTGSWVNENEKGTTGSEGPVTDSNWALYTTVIDGDTLSTYYNGTKIGTETTGIRLADLGTDLDAFIGKSHYPDIFYKGGVRDVRIYNGALNEQRVAELYNETKFSGNLLAHYDFSTVQTDENGMVADQTVIQDVSGNGNSATLYKGNSAENTNATVEGDILTFAGTTVDDTPYLQLPDNLNVGKKAMTVSMWLGSQRRDYASAAWYAGQGTGRYWMLNPRTDADVVRNFVTRSGAQGEQNVAHDASKYTVDGSLILYTLVMENGKLSTYMNGQLVGSNDATGISLADLSDNCKVYIGRSGYSGDCYQGDVRDVRIYDRALTEEEVKALFDGTADVSEEPTLDSAGSSTRLVADSGNARGTMTFTFKGRGLDIIGRSTTDTAGLSLVIKDEEGKVVKSQIVDTSYANGKLYQLPIISIKDLDYGTYTVTLRAMKTQNRTEQTLINDSLYIDAIRIYDPANTKAEKDEKGDVSKYYLNGEYKADTPEVRELLLGSVKFKNLDAALKNSEKLEEGDSGTTTTTMESSVSLVTFDEELGTAIYHAGSAQVENPDTNAEIHSHQTLEKILKRGPNNEVYLAKGNAVAFRAVPAASIPEEERTLQVEAKKVADDKGAAELTFLTDQKNTQDEYDPQRIELTTYTPMYYRIDMSKCNQYSDNSYLVILASTGDSMVSLTNLKVKGYTLEALEEDDVHYGAQITALADTYRMMKLMFVDEPEDVDTKPDTGKEDAKELPFVDVQEGSWYEPYVRYVYEKEIMTGLDETHFGPEQTICRAQFAVMLYRMAGSPKVEYKPLFKDVADNQFYTDAVIWAGSKEAGVITGYTGGANKGCFGYSDNITREQMAVMMYRYANYLNCDTSGRTDFDTFEDAESVSAYADDAMRWAVGNGIITGKYNGTKIDPQGDALRAECAIIIQRFLDRYEK